jgi:trk system potassium uptake protein TrkH
MDILDSTSKSFQLAAILRLCSVLIFLFGLTMMVPVFVGLLYHERDAYAFLMTFGVALLLGVIGISVTKRDNSSLKTRNGFLVAVLFWIIFSAISALPFILDQRLQLSVTDAFFEAISGITTTGSTILTHVDGLPKSILYYRAQLNFLGGLGIIVLAVAILPLLGIGGSKLYQAEMPGPLKEEKLTPQLADMAKHLWFIYSGLALAGILAYWLAGMNLFDAVCHSLSTVALGGFSTHDASIGFYNSASIELVGGVFSLLAAVNFALYFFAISRGSLKPIYTDSEFRFFIAILSLVVSVTMVILYASGTFDGKNAFVHGFFQAISVMTDNGLATANYPGWPPSIVLLLLGASFFGGCVGSTCGGIKAMRFLMLYRQGYREIKQLIHPNAVYAVKIGKRPVSDRVIRSVWSLFFLYIAFTCLFVWLLVLTGTDFTTAFGSVAASINNMGIGYGETATGFGSLNASAKWVLSAAMLFGRLEIFPILIVLSKTFWKY